MANRFKMFDCPVGKDHSELDLVLSPLMQRLKNLFAHPVAIVWMNPLQHRVEVGETLLGIKTPEFDNFPQTSKQALSR